MDAELGWWAARYLSGGAGTLRYNFVPVETSGGIFRIEISNAEQPIIADLKAAVTYNGKELE